jgi:hypothetical protein
MRRPREERSVYAQVLGRLGLSAGPLNETTTLYRDAATGVTHVHTWCAASLDMIEDDLARHQTRLTPVTVTFLERAALDLCHNCGPRQPLPRRQLVWHDTLMQLHLILNELEGCDQAMATLAPAAVLNTIDAQLQRVRHDLAWVLEMFQQAPEGASTWPRLLVELEDAVDGLEPHLSHIAQRAAHQVETRQQQLRDHQDLLRQTLAVDVAYFELLDRYRPDTFLGQAVVDALDRWRAAAGGLAAPTCVADLAWERTPAALDRARTAVHDTLGSAEVPVVFDPVELDGDWTTAPGPDDTGLSWCRTEWAARRDVTRDRLVAELERSYHDGLDANRAVVILVEGAGPKWRGSDVVLSGETLGRDASKLRTVVAVDELGGRWLQHWVARAPAGSSRICVLGDRTGFTPEVAQTFLTLLEQEGMDGDVERAGALARALCLPASQERSLGTGQKTPQGPVSC